MCSRNHKPFRAAKLNHMRFEGELDDSFGPALAPSVVNTRHEISESQRTSPRFGLDWQDLINFHVTIIQNVRIHILLRPQGGVPFDFCSITHSPLAQLPRTPAFAPGPRLFLPLVIPRCREMVALECAQSCDHCPCKPRQLHNWTEIILPKDRLSDDDAAKKKGNLWVC
jgi:hypothetical protein